MHTGMGRWGKPRRPILHLSRNDPSEEYPHRSDKSAGAFAPIFGMRYKPVPIGGACRRHLLRNVCGRYLSDASDATAVPADNHVVHIITVCSKIQIPRIAALSGVAGMQDP